jgi:hypothetical protein
LNREARPVSARWSTTALFVPFEILLDYQLPPDVAVESVDIVVHEPDLVLTDHRQFKLDLSESGHATLR